MTCSGYCLKGGSVQPLIKLCHPMPGIMFSGNDIPPVMECGVYSFNLNDYPINQATTYKNGNWMFGQSEMVLIEYMGPGGQVVFNIVDPMGKSFHVRQNIPGVYGMAWAVAGRFNKTSGFSVDEIIIPGNYKVEVITSYGQSNIDFWVM